MISEEKQNIQKAIKFTFLTIIAVILLFFYGIPILGKFAGFVSDLAKGDKPIVKTDKTPPAPPQIEDLPEFTNQKTIKITGKSEEGAIIKFKLNSKNEEIVANSEGKFSIDFHLNDGKNTIDVMAIDSSGNESQKTETKNVTFDNSEPKLTLGSPSDGSLFFGSRQRQVSIKGSVDDKDTRVTVNDKFVAVEDNGDFQFTTTLNEGVNKFSIKAIDPAGNSSEKDLSLNFTP